jgi:hypothetical protein
MQRNLQSTGMKIDYQKKRFKGTGSQNFGSYAKKFQDRQKRQINRGELVDEMFKNDNLYLQKDILPAFGSTHISKIDYNSVDIFRDE